MSGRVLFGLWGQRLLAGQIRRLIHVSPAVSAFKSDLTIKWIRPDPIPVHDPRKSGDLETLPKIDMTQVHEMLRDSKVYQSASDVDKKLFTFEFTNRLLATRQYKRDVMRKTQSHLMDTGSLEAAIGALTGRIRVMQGHMEKNPYDKMNKIKLCHAIDRRKKFLTHLRRWDYKRFEWVLEQLNIVYKPDPMFAHWITRRSSLRRLTDKHCDRFVNEQLDAYKQELEGQQEGFLRDKVAKLEFILKEREELGFTDNPDEIAEEKRQLEDARATLEKVQSEQQKLAASE